MNVSSLKEHVYDVIGAIHEVHRELGPGLNEYCYQEGLEIELTERDIPFLREPVFHPKYHGKEMESTYKLDFLCKGDIIIECKAVVDLANTHRAQLFNYMILTKSSCGLLVNFQPIYATIERYFYDKDRHEILTVAGTPIHREQ
ncbi:MAG: GxxExxY protein [Bacteroidales bacterium]|nr:GxxExxY protein [Bacteroidales bacterium]